MSPLIQLFVLFLSRKKMAMATLFICLVLPPFLCFRNSLLE